MNAIKLLLAMLFVFLLCNTAFAKTGGIEMGIAPDVTGTQIATGLTGNDDPVNFRRGKGKDGDGGDDDGGNSGSGSSGSGGGSGQSGNGRGDRADGCEDGDVGPGDIACD